MIPRLVAPPVERMPAIWISTSHQPDPRMPAGGVQLSVQDARALIDGASVPIEIARAWIYGADVEHAENAPLEVRGLAHRLRVLLPRACRPFEPRIGAEPRAQGRRAEDRPPSVTQLANTIIEDLPEGMRQLTKEARLLQALASL